MFYFYAQYAVSTNTIFVDKRDDLFQPFHSLMTHAIDIIADSYLLKTTSHVH
jgi:hypothetical protein